MTARVLVSIINYKTADLTIAAAQSALDALGSLDARVAIVDNASGDGSLETISAWLDAMGDSRVQLVESEMNSGFSGGHNQGMAVDPDADFYLILNSDALIRPGLFEALLEAAEARPEIGLFAPQLEWEDGTPQVSCFRFPGPVSELMRGARTGPVSRIFQKYVVSLALPPEADAIEWASFACILLRGDMVREIGQMDDGYFLYFEDVEYAHRASQSGWGVAYVPEARAVHFRGGSGPVKKMQAEMKRLPDYYWRSRTRLMRQAHGVAGPLMANLAWLMGRAIAWSRVVAGRSVPKSHKHEWRDIWTGILAPLAPDRRAR